MSEPRLEDIEDYDTLKGEKKKVVWTVIASGLIIGVITLIAFECSEKEEPIAVEKTFQQVLVK